MIRVAIACLALGSVAACGRSQGIADKDLGGLVVETKQAEAPISVERASTDPRELGRALVQPYAKLVAALGPHTIVLASKTTVEEAGKPATALDEATRLELGDAGTFHATYTNTADYGREATFVGGKLYLRPRYQRWHGRAPESADEPVALRASFVAPIAATWDLLAPGAELTDQGAAQVAGHAGRKIGIKLSPKPAKPATETVTQRKWREQRTVEELVGEVVLDAEKGVPLSVKLSGTVAFSRDGRRFRMKTSLSAELSAIGTPVAIAAPPEGEVVATPERQREVDDRDFLLQGIAPPIRKNADGSAVTPQPAAPPAPGAVPAPKTDAPPADEPKKKKRKKADDEGAAKPETTGDTNIEKAVDPPKERAE